MIFFVNLRPNIDKLSYKNDKESIYLNLLPGFKNSYSNRTDSQVFEFSRPHFVLIFPSRGRPRPRKPGSRNATLVLSHKKYKTSQKTINVRFISFIFKKVVSGK